MLGFISFFNIYLFIWPHGVFVAVFGIFHCDEQTSLQLWCKGSKLCLVDLRHWQVDSLSLGRLGNPLAQSPLAISDHMVGEMGGKGELWEVLMFYRAFSCVPLALCCLLYDLENTPNSSFRPCHVTSQRLLWTMNSIMELLMSQALFFSFSLVAQPGTEPTALAMKA